MSYGTHIPKSEIVVNPSQVNWHEPEGSIIYPVEHNAHCEMLIHNSQLGRLHAWQESAFESYYSVGRHFLPVLSVFASSLIPARKFYSELLSLNESLVKLLVSPLA